MIKNIILDLGGVIIDIDYKRTTQAFLALGSDQFDNYYCQKNQVPLFDELETGKIDEQEFRIQLRNLLKLEATDQELDAAWNAMLLEVPDRRLLYLRELSNHYNLYLFSNTNSIHLRKVHEEVNKHTHISQNLDDFFKKTYYSHLFGHRKPKPHSFQEIVRLNNLAKEETVFVDDSYQHIIGAELAGLHTIYLTHPHDLTHLETLINELEVEDHA